MPFVDRKLTRDLCWVFVFTDSLERRLAEQSIICPSCKYHFGDHLRLDPMNDAAGGDAGRRFPKGRLSFARAA